MSAIQMFFAALALVGASILYVAGGVLLEPPVWTSLAGREMVTVMEATVESRAGDDPALAVVDVRGAAGTTSVVQGNGWGSRAKAEALIATYEIGSTVELPRWRGHYWHGVSGLGQWILTLVSAVAAFVALFGIWMVWKLRGSR